MLVQFKARPGKLMYRGQPGYRKKDWGFDFEPPQVGGDCAVLVGDVEILFDSVLRCACQLSGFCPHTRWIRKSLSVPEAFMGSFLLLDDTIDAPDIVRLDGTPDWNVSYDPQTGWICIGYDTHDSADVSVEFATDTIAVLHTTYLKALWLKPTLYM